MRVSLLELSLTLIFLDVQIAAPDWAIPQSLHEEHCSFFRDAGICAGGGAACLRLQNLILTLQLALVPVLRERMTTNRCGGTQLTRDHLRWLYAQ